MRKLNVSQFRDLKILLRLQTWIYDADFTKNVFVDVHVFDARDQVIRAETLTLGYLGPAGGGGDFFLFDGPIYDGANAGPGWVAFAPDARKVQYRLYYEVRGTLYSDGLLRQHDLPADQEI